MELLTDPHMWVALATLTLLELVLGIDNIIFISILVSKLPKAQQEMARRIGSSSGKAPVKFTIRSKATKHQRL